MFSLIPWRGEKRSRGELARREDNPFALMRREFDDLFDRVFGSWPLAEVGAPGWGLDLEDAGDAFVVRAEAPGFEPGDFDVQVTGDALHVVAEHKEEEPGKEGEARASRYGRFERWVSLPPGTDRDKVEARYRNGVLEVRLPKTKEALGRRVEVKA
jgi:HSP20 family protein